MKAWPLVLLILALLTAAGASTTGAGDQKETKNIRPMRYYVSITGLEIKSLWHYPGFWYHAVRSFEQARGSAGNVHADTRGIKGIQHTMTVWETRSDMLKFYRSGVHLEAMKASEKVGSYGKVYGYESEHIPSWEEAHRIWEEKGRVVLGEPRPGDLGGPHWEVKAVSKAVSNSAGTTSSSTSVSS